MTPYNRETIHDRELRRQMDDWQFPAPKPQKTFTAGDLAVGVVACFMVAFFAFQQAYQYGYDAGREACRPRIKQEIKPMTHKQQVRWAAWMMRDKGVIR